MSSFWAIIEFIQNMSLEDDEINKILKAIDEINVENIKTNYHREELDREHMRLQIELSDLEVIINQTPQVEVENAVKTTKKVYGDSMDLERLIDKIDYTKILQCRHMEMEAKWHKEWEPIQERVIETLQWHNKMAQRHIVRIFKQTEDKLKTEQDIKQSQKQTIAKSLQQSRKVFEKLELKRNEIILNIIKGVKNIENLNESLSKIKKHEVYINDLRREKFNLNKQRQHKVFNPVITANDVEFIALNSSQNLAAMNNIAPQLPSFMDILNSFNERSPNQITVIENTTNVSVKSILHNSNDNSIKTNRSIICRQTKHVHFKLEEYAEDNNKNLLTGECENGEIETDLSPTIPKEITTIQEGLVEHSLQKEIETVDLLKTNRNVNEAVGELVNTTNDTEKCKKLKKPPIEILECITFKTPQPLAPIQMNNNQKFDKENLLNTSTDSSSKQLNNTFTACSTSTESIQKSANVFNKTFYEEFISTSSSSAEVSPKTQGANKCSMVKDFESYFNERKEFLFASNSKNSKENYKLNEPELVFAQTNPTNKESNDENKNSTETKILDFDNEKGFTFDSEDNMSANCNATDSDFL